jgi:hypothetical protein
MKYLIIFPLFLMLFLKTSAQTASGSPDTTVYGSVETNFPGGQQAYNNYIMRHARFPAVAYENNVQGCIYIKFLIERDSSISNVKIYSGAGSGMDDEGLKLIKQSGKWLPSKLNGISVQTACIVPIRFILTAGESNKLNGNVDGNASDTSYLSSITAFESSGVSLANISNYTGKSVKFVGRVYGAKKISDTTFTLTCGEYNYPEKYVNVVLIGKNAQLDNPKAKLSGYLIKGMGTVINYNGTLIIVIEDKKQYILMPGFRQKL